MSEHGFTHMSMSGVNAARIIFRFTFRKGGRVLQQGGKVSMRSGLRAATYAEWPKQCQVRPRRMRRSTAAGVEGALASQVTST